MKEIQAAGKKPAACHCLNLRRAAQSMTDYYNTALAPSNINLTQYSLLKTLRRLEPVNVSELAKAMQLDRTTLVRNLKSIMEKEYITDLALSAKRDRQLQLTAKGQETLEAATILWNNAQDNVQSYLGQDKLAMLTALLFQIETIS